MKIDPREADLKYKPFPSFVKWKQTELDLERWEKSVVELDSAKENNKENLTEALEIAKRAAAIESGAIEDLYDVDRGFTFTVAFQKAMWELKLEEKGSETISHIEAQLEGYDFVLDFATKQAPLIPAWIRELHQVICKNQESYQVYTEAGIQKKPLELGAYKNMPNHVLTQEGEIHAYCPVEFTPNEMTRLCDEIAGEVFQKSHPILQASYTHYALTVIHPFSDGNGRVARALASVFTYRSSSIPILIFSDDRPDYFKSLNLADKGTYQSFTNLILDKTIDSIDLVVECLNASERPSIESELETLNSLYTTRGGYSQDDVDKAALTLIGEFITVVNEVLEELVNSHAKITSKASIFQQNVGRKPSGYRHIKNTSKRNISISIVTEQPVKVNGNISLGLFIPIDCDETDEIILQNDNSSYIFKSRVNQLLPSVSTSLKIKMRVFIEGMIGNLLSQLGEEGLKILKRESTN